MSGDILRPTVLSTPRPAPARAVISGRSRILLLCAVLPPFGWFAILQYGRARRAAEHGDAYAARVH